MINLTGQCMIRLSHWTPEYDFHDVAVGNYNWIRMSNLPLHYWNYDSIMAVLRPLGDLIYVQKKGTHFIATPKSFHKAEISNYFSNGSCSGR